MQVLKYSADRCLKMKLENLTLPVNYFFFSNQVYFGIISFLLLKQTGIVGVVGSVEVWGVDCWAAGVAVIHC